MVGTDIAPNAWAFTFSQELRGYDLLPQAVIPAFNEVLNEEKRLDRWLETLPKDTGCSASKPIPWPNYPERERWVTSMNNMDSCFNRLMKKRIPELLKIFCSVMDLPLTSVHVRILDQFTMPVIQHDMKVYINRLLFIKYHVPVHFSILMNSLKKRMANMQNYPGPILFLSSCEEDQEGYSGGMHVTYGSLSDPGDPNSKFIYDSPSTFTRRASPQAIMLVGRRVGSGMRFALGIPPFGGPTHAADAVLFMHELLHIRDFSRGNIKDYNTIVAKTFDDVQKKHLFAVEPGLPSLTPSQTRKLVDLTRIPEDIIKKYYSGNFHEMEVIGVPPAMREHYGLQASYTLNENIFRHSLGLRPRYSWKWADVAEEPEDE